MDCLDAVIGEIERLSKRSGIGITQDYIDALAGSMREYGASEVFIQVLHAAMDISGPPTDTDTARTR